MSPSAEIRVLSGAGFFHRAPEAAPERARHRECTALMKACWHSLGGQRVLVLTSPPQRPRMATWPLVLTCCWSWRHPKWHAQSLSCVWFFATPWTIAHQASLSMGFSRQESWSGLPFPSPVDLPDPRIEPGSPALQADALSSEPPGKQKLTLKLH